LTRHELRNPLLALAELLRRHETAGGIAQGGRLRVVLRRGQRQPLASLHTVLRHAVAFRALHAEVELRRRVALFRRQTIPAGRPGFVLRHAAARVPVVDD
jgi:hypothetical protein